MMSYFFPSTTQTQVDHHHPWAGSVDRVRWLVLVLAFLKELHVVKEPAKEKYFKGTPMGVSETKTIFCRKSNENTRLRLPGPSLR